MAARLHHVGVRVADLARSTRFYHDVFGLVVLGRSTLPDAEIAFVGPPIASPSAGGRLAAALAGTVTLELSCKASAQSYSDVAVLQHLALRVDRLEPTLELARAAGAEIIRPIGDVAAHGFRTFWCRSPDGERIEVWEDL